MNEILMLHGIEINKKGEYISIAKAESISEIQRLYNYNVHAYVFKCCREELLQENYYHTVH